MKVIKCFAVVIVLIISSLSATSLAIGSDSEILFNSENIIEGEFIVSIKEDDDFSTQDTNKNIQSKIDSLHQKYSSIFSREDFKVIHSFLGSKHSNRNNSINTYSFDSSSENNLSEVLDDEMKETIVKKMGHVQLVSYSTKKYKSKKNAKEALEKLLKKNGINVNYIEPNYKVYALDTVSTQEVTSQINSRQKWHYDMINVYEAWKISTGSKDVKIAVLDTGIDHTHQSLKALVDTNLGKSFVGGDTTDRNGHGTHVAGTIASTGNVSGVMQIATLIPVKVLNDSGSGNLYSMQQGILYAAQINADVVNMSVGGGGYSKSFDSTCKTAASKGTIIVAAAGNSGRGTLSYPAAYNSVISVGAVDSNGNRASFSQYGQGLDVMAPGVNIYSTYPNNSYKFMTGTSMACPHVAGLVGLIKSINKSISFDEVMAILSTTAENSKNSTYYGYGIVDAAKALQNTAGTTHTSPTQTIPPLQTIKPTTTTHPTPTQTVKPTVTSYPTPVQTVQPTATRYPTPTQTIKPIPTYTSYPNVDIALNKPVTASNTVFGYNKQYVVDGNSDTFWTSHAYREQWLYIDFGKNEYVDKLKIKWSEKNFPKQYYIQYYNGIQWVTHKTLQGSGNWNEIDFNKDSRYIRIVCTNPNSSYYTMYSLEAYK